jgi:hypothetical protein
LLKEGRGKWKMSDRPKISRRYKQHLAAERSRCIKRRAYLRGRRAKAKADRAKALLVTDRTSPKFGRVFDRPSNPKTEVK